MFIPPSTEQVTRFEVADFSSEGLALGNRPTLHLEPGIYHVRITTSTDGSLELYMSVRCEHRYENGSCAMFHSFVGVR